MNDPTQRKAASQAVTPPAEEEAAAWSASVVRPDDWLFEDSPDSGAKDCLCSRCRKLIGHKDGPAIRVWPKSGGEYRYHSNCLGMPTP